MGGHPAICSAACTGSDAPSSPQLRPRAGIFGGQAFICSGRAALSPDSPTARALFLLPGARRGFAEWGLVVRDLASPGISPARAARLVGQGVVQCALVLPPAPWRLAPEGHCVLPDTLHNTLQELPGGVFG